MAGFPAEYVDVFDGGGVGREEEHHRSRGRSTQRPGEAQQREGAEEPSRVHFHVGNHAGKRKTENRKRKGNPHREHPFSRFRFPVSRLRAIFGPMPEPIPFPKSVTPVRRALVSVHDKTGVSDLAVGLAAAGVKVVSTGGTAAHLKKAGVEVALVEDETGFPEILGGRVKTLHPKIFGGVLADATRDDHARDMEMAAIEAFDLVVVNLYPFEQTIA